MYGVSMEYVWSIFGGIREKERRYNAVLALEKTV